ncbi:MAG: FimV/HubP family polar landmark protein, partial [Gammaproteobacteria bacterium]
SSEVDIDLSFPTGEPPSITPQEGELGASATARTTATEIQTSDKGVESDAPGGPMSTVHLEPAQMSTVRLSEDQMLDDIADPAVPAAGTASGQVDVAGTDEDGVGVDTEFIDIFGPADAQDSTPGSEVDLTSTLGGTSGTEEEGLDEVQTKIDLAQTYLDMEDIDSARGVLTEVLKDGTPDQQASARKIMTDIDK